MAWDSVDLESLDESRGVGRRSFLIGALAAGAAASAPINYAAAARRGAGALAKEGRFDLGVAAGFPRPRGIMLWTHLDEVKGSPKVRLVVAKDNKFSNVVEERLVTASSKNGHTARTFVNGLDPREQYFYRFLTEGSKSEVGRFRTAPPLNSREKIRIAFYSCQHYEAGFFNAQRAIAREKDIDLVICLGDYIYEYSDAEIRPNDPRRDSSGRNNDGDVQFLDEYREKYHLYKRDRNLKAMHAAHPFISVWDDHEVEDNHADGKPSSAQTNPNLTNQGQAAPGQLRTAPHERLQGLLRLHAAGPLQGRAQPHLRGLPPRQARRPDADRRAPVSRPAALQRRDSRGLPGSRGPAHAARREPEELVAAQPQGLALDLEGLGHPADADEPAARSKRPGPGRRLGRLRLRAQADPRLHHRQRRPERGRRHRRHPHLLRRHRLHEGRRGPPGLTGGPPRVRRRLGDLPRHPRGDRPLDATLERARGGQPPHRLLRLPQAAATA